MKLPYKKILFYLTIACLFTPFLVSSNTYFPFIIAKATAFRLIVEAMLVVWVFWLVRSRTSKESPTSLVSLTPLIKAVLIFGAIIFISALLGVDFSYSFFSGNERMEGVFGIWHFMLFFLIIATTFNYLEIEKILKIQVGIGILYSFIALLAYSGIGKITAQFTGNRLAGYTGNPSFFAAYLLFNAFLALYFYFRQYVFDKKLFNWWLPVFLGQSFLLFATLTRGVMIGYLISLIFIAFGIMFLKSDSQGKSDFFNPFKKISIVLLIGILVISVFTFSAKNTDFVKNNPILSRFSSISLTDPTAVSRILSAKTAWKSFLQKPFFGWGLENYEAPYIKNFNPEVLKYLPEDFYFDRAHNKPMEVLALTGVFGFLSYLSIFGIALYFLNHLRKKKEWFLPSLALAGGLTGYFIQNVFIFDFHESYLMFFLVLAFISSLSSNTSDTQKTGEQKPSKTLVKNPSDYSLKMGKSLLVVAVICLVIFSSSQWVIKPYLVSKGIFNVGYFIRQEQSEEAYKELKRIINDPAFLRDDIVVGINKMYSIYDFKINEEYKEKIVEALVIQAREAVQQRPWSFNLAMAEADLETVFSQWDQSRLKEAKKSMERMLSQFPYFPITHLFASKFFLLNGEIEKAIKEAEKVIEVDWQIPTSYYLLALAHNELGDSEKRNENLIKAAELNFPFKDKAQILSVINLLVKEKKYETIKNLYLQAIQIDSNDASLYSSLAATYAKMHDKEKAIEFAKKAASLDPQKYSKEAEIFIQAMEQERWEIVGDN
ncbi:MAG: O-antigen ligase family protein [Candidatus Paceibacterota bacterium]|jgi:O-antigen ligase